jgi:uncharacterized protein with NRDE domain
MCLINFAFQHHREYPFILVANRDEFYSRPTKELHWWEDMPHVLAGKDLKDGGTWMGMNKYGRIAALTNYRNPELVKHDAPSRGGLLKTFLNGAISLDDFHQYLKTEGRLYNGFNIIYGTTNEMFYYANTNDRWLLLRPGIYGLSNAFLDTPWQKVLWSKLTFTSLLSSLSLDKEDYFSMMQNRNTADDALLPSTGVPYEIEKKLSACFIAMENYGTRLSTFIRIDELQNVAYCEKSYVPAGEVSFTFQIQKS